MDYLKVVLTTLLSAAALFLITKIMGHKQIAHLDLFDYVTGITIGSIAAELATALEDPIKPLISLVLFGLISFTLSILSLKSARIRKYLNGTPTIIMNDGKLYEKNMKKAKLELSEFLVLCRQEGYFDLSAIKTAVYEFNGKMTFLPVSTRRPATPADLNLSPKQEAIFTEIIMDGRVLESNLKRKGLNLEWLSAQLKTQKYTSARGVYLGLCDDSNNLSLYGYE